MNASFEDQLALLRQKFRARAAAQSSALEGLALELERGSVESSGRVEIGRIAHSLSGAAGTFGFSEVSSCASELEDFITESFASAEIASSCRRLIAAICHEP